MIETNEARRQEHPTNCSGHFGGTCTCGLLKKTAQKERRRATEKDSIKAQLTDLGFDSGDFDADLRALLSAHRDLLARIEHG